MEINIEFEGYLMPFRITNNISGLFRMYDGSLEKLPVCVNCLVKSGYTSAYDFNIREFFRKHNYESQIPDRILADIWLGATEGIYGGYPKNWNSIISPVYRAYEGKCEICGTNQKLHVHHINMYKPDTTQKNLIVLCGSCHTTIHNAIRKIAAGNPKFTCNESEKMQKYNLIIKERKENHGAGKN